jgi:hypothetical protein
MTERTKLILTLTGLLVVLPVASVVYIVGYKEWPGGMRPSYAAADYDPRLTRVAATAAPLIDALERYHDDHSAFPAHAADFVSYLSSPPPEPPTPGSDYILDWQYFKHTTNVGYILYRSLGWDPTLQYHHDGSKAHWVFNPGDGSPEKNIILEP